jgi:hypothetical protein
MTHKQFTPALSIMSRLFDNATLHLAHKIMSNRFRNYGGGLLDKFSPNLERAAK